jgi:dTDP-4-amino-4,6-dideoxygalactose transaminase
VIEDSCEAFGATYKGRQAGTLGDYGMFAFYPTSRSPPAKAAWSSPSDDKAADFMRALRNQGRAVGDTWLQHTYLGYNYRLDEMSAALGTEQMKRLDELISKREQVAGWYEARLSEIPGVEIPFIESIHHTCPGSSMLSASTQKSTAMRWQNASKRWACLLARISCPFTCSPTWSSASAIARAISPSPKTWGGAGWPCHSAA